MLIRSCVCSMECKEWAKYSEDKLSSYYTFIYCPFCGWELIYSVREATSLECSLINEEQSRLKT